MDRLRNVLSGNHLVDQLKALKRAQDGEKLDSQEVNAMAKLYQRVVANVPPETLAEAHEEALSSLKPEQRQLLLAEFQKAHTDPRQAFRAADLDQDGVDDSPQRISTLTQQAQQQQPDILGELLRTAASNPAVQAAIAAMVGALLKQLLGNVLGGALGGGGGQPQSQPANNPGKIPTQQQPIPMPQQQTPQQQPMPGSGEPTQPMGGSLNDILGQVLGSSAGSAILGSLLQQVIAGGGTSGQRSR